VKAPKRNLAASVAARLLHQARRTGDDYQTLLTAYVFERFLYGSASRTCAIGSTSGVQCGSHRSHEQHIGPG
jgi:hypothetical protein